MKVLCPHCGQLVEVNGLGRKRYEIGVKNILDTLASTHSIDEAAKKLNCSRGYIYATLKANRLTAKKVLARG